MLAVAFCVHGCATVRPSEAVARPPPPIVEQAVTPPAPAERVECSGPRPPSDWLTTGPVLIGEIHGTVETPAVASAFACHASSDGGTVLLGLEIPRGEQPAIDVFLETGDTDALLRGAHWTRAYQDGRSSLAMVALLEEVHRLQHAGRVISVIAYDVDPESRAPDRDLAMAEFLFARWKPEAERLIVLVGNIHARTAVALPRPMGWRLRQLGVKPHSLLIEAVEGEGWYCPSMDARSCGVHRAARASQGEAPVGELSYGVEGIRGYDARILLPRFTASRPAGGASSSAVPSAASPAPPR